MKIIDEWRNAWKFLSVQASGIGIAISATYASLYDQLKDNFPPKCMAILTCVVFLAGIVGRIISQTPKDDTK